MRSLKLNPARTREWLESLGHHPRQKLGQNFLVDANIVDKSVRLAEICEGDAVVEIGPGLGTLTSALLETGAEVFAVEFDRVLARHLNTIGVEDREKGKFHLTEGDAVEIPLGTLPEQHPPETPFKIVANLPYAIATPWMDAVLKSGYQPERMVLMLQREAALRYCAKVGEPNRGAISIFLQQRFETTGRHRVPQACFIPRPAVESVLLVLQRKAGGTEFLPETRRCIRTLFTQRRKQLGSLIRRETVEITEATRAWLAWLEKQGQAKLRPEALPDEGWAKLDRFFRETGQR